MRRACRLRFVSRVEIAVSALVVAACAPESVPTDLLSRVANSDSGVVIVSSQNTSSVVSFYPDGRYRSIVRDISQNSEVPYGLAYWRGGIRIAIDGSDRIENVGLSNGIATAFSTNVNLAISANSGLAMDASGNSFVVEPSANTIEKLDSSGARIGSPYIGTTVGACTLSVPRGAVEVTSNGRIAVGSAGNHRLLLYTSDVSSCTSITAAPFGAGSPGPVAYHPQTDKILVGMGSWGSILATSNMGTSVTTAYNNTSIVNGVTGITVDTAGYVYVVGTTYDTVEKFSFNGTTLTRVGNSPFIPANAFVRDPAFIVVVP